MKFKIESCVDGRVLFEGEFCSLKLCVEAAVKARANLAAAYLAAANLDGANLAAANLAGANLDGANLAGANLDGANLARAYLAAANLAAANLAAANLAGANLAGANLDGANLARAIYDGPPPADKETAIANLDRVREIILDDEKRLFMNHWHDNSKWKERTCAEEATCGTTHCLAGWLQVCSTDEKIRQFPANVAGYLCAPVAAKMFYKTNADVLAWMKDRKYTEEAQ